jgi:hypothetical protein
MRMPRDDIDIVGDSLANIKISHINYPVIALAPK